MSATRPGALALLMRRWMADRVPVVRVVIEQARGSTPREAGAAMLVTQDAMRGTIGGGRLELEAVAEARRLLADGSVAHRWSVALGPALGQCCGGHVVLLAERADERVIEAQEMADHLPLPLVLLFGAGHVGRAVARALAPLPLRTRWIDARADEFDTSVAGSVERAVSSAWQAEIDAAPAGSACLVMTHSHALDSLVTAAALERADFAYVGLIGSHSKRRRFEQAFRDVGIGETAIARLVCPIGDRGIRDKRPEVIAALTAAELIEVFAEPVVRTRITKAEPSVRATLSASAYFSRGTA
ncbi:xanthine dehydrogenase accessory protein XdhC [Lichenihabitans psoromatis]|uniref:xanthine dehydrogenase accessory protein XdhC n=1 Tax=Lichenihabitans psoromatis TaxID=2528642 RepID=UPI001FE1DFC2|nr:xanthine dehydrogenase accessory protein XdhC [Lichenihabitans psoromatis]